MPKCDPKNLPCTAQCSEACAPVGELRVSVEKNKYTIVVSNDGNLRALRYGEPWQDLTGNKMVYCLATELYQARWELAAAEEREARWEAAYNDLLQRT